MKVYFVNNQTYATVQQIKRHTDVYIPQIGNSVTINYRNINTVYMVKNIHIDYTMMGITIYMEPVTK